MLEGSLLTQVVGEWKRAALFWKGFTNSNVCTLKVGTHLRREWKNKFFERIGNQRTNTNSLLAEFLRDPKSLLTNQIDVGTLYVQMIFLFLTILADTEMAVVQLSKWNLWFTSWPLSQENLKKTLRKLIGRRKNIARNLWTSLGSWIIFFTF